MPSKISRPRLLVFKNKNTPSRDSWVIYPCLHETGFSACHEIANSTQETKTLDEVQVLLQTLDEVRQFCENLTQHGWTTHFD